MKLYRTTSGLVIEHEGQHRRIPSVSWDDAFNDPDSCAALGTACPPPDPATLLPPIGHQEVWAAGVTYFRSRDARMEEAQVAGGSNFYAKVYLAERPELFFKAAPFRVIGPGGQVRLRRDARWTVPEPELTLALDRSGSLRGFTIGNDMSSRDIEGENPLYLPQAKIYDGACALGPCVLFPTTPLPPSTEIHLAIRRRSATAFEGMTTLAQIKRSFASLAEFLYRETTFPHGAYLLTGTGIVPPTNFSLAPGDEIHITIPPIGCLLNTVAPL